MKLKTLKEIEENGERFGKPTKFVECKDLKAEAIKWVNYLSGSNLIEDNDKVNWIMKFFNITEEDLAKT